MYYCNTLDTIRNYIASTKKDDPLLSNALTQYLFC